MGTTRSPSRQGRPRIPSPVNSYSSSPPSSMSSYLAPLESGCSSLASTPPELPAHVDRKTEAEQRALSTVEDAISAIRARAGLTTVASSGKTLGASDPLLYLPPLLSRLPTHTQEAAAPFSGESTIDYTNSHLPRIDATSLALHRALHIFRPVTPLYAISPYPASFNWADVVLEDDAAGNVKAQEREWYIVAFRSKRRDGFTPEEALDLYGADREAHEEAVQSGGLLLYWFGSPFPSEADAPPATTASHALPWSTDLAGRNLATCIWQSRADAVDAMKGERHKRAAKLASRSYESYTLERYVLRKDAGDLTVRVEPWHGREVAGASVLHPV
ncbi:hypothetical protein JCM10908_007192 [Rhodotorula pacifica]|uniref:uncharacterized protein n=1 Tax=Rhodotorula pacifica TaxID=1495444 RepID=UPI00316E153B